jgi:hypothetical protein
MFNFKKGDEVMKASEVLNEFKELVKKKPFMDVTNYACHDLIAFALHFEGLVGELSQKIDLQDRYEKDPLSACIYECLKEVRQKYGKYRAFVQQKYHSRDTTPISQDQIKSFLNLLSKNVHLIFEDKEGEKK